MKEKILYAVWAAMGILCAGMGFIENPTGLGKAILVVLALGCFIPGGLLLYHGYQTKSKTVLGRVCIVAGCSLGLTVVALGLNFASLQWSTAVGDSLYQLLVVVSTPMVCGQNWLMSLFLWACLLFAGLSLRRMCKVE